MRILRMLVVLILAVAFALLLGTGALLLAPLPPMPDVAARGDVLLRDVNVVDVRSGTVLAGRDLLVRDGVIAAVADAGSIDAEQGVSLVAASGKYAIPGLWDMHTHSTQLASQYQHPLYLANGVTGVREMWGCMSEPDSLFACQQQREDWNQALARGETLSPRFVAHASFQINGGNEVPEGFPEYFRVADAAQAEQLVDFYKSIGVEFLKVYSELSPQSWLDLASAARERGLYLAGHRPFAVSLEQVLQQGQRTVEHPRLFLFECFEEAQAFRALPDPRAVYDMDFRRSLVQRHDRQRCASLMRDMAASDTAWVPTLQVLQMSARAVEEAFRNDARLRFVPWPIRQGIWQPDASRAAAQARQPGHADTYSQLYRLAQENVAQAHAAGVTLLLGTDAGDTYVFPGFGVHDELEQLVGAGIPPAAALRMATIEPARFVGLEQRFGSIEPGRAADILLLGANPLIDIAATREIEALLFNGEFFDRAGLDHLLQFAEDRSASWQLNLQLLWSALSSPIVRQQFAD